jgi:hypothetical protein
MGLRGARKSSVSEISSEQNTHYDAEKSFWMKFANILELARLDERMLALGGRADRTPTRDDSIRESSSSLTPCPLVGETRNVLLDNNGSRHP